MALGPGDHDVRKLQATGGSTFTLSLPKPWVLHNQLEPRSSLKVDWRPSGALRITPLQQNQRVERHVRINLDEIPRKSLHDHLMGAYISGADVIVVFHSEDQPPTKIIRRFLRSTRGFEIVEEHVNSTELRCLLNPGDMPLHASLKRMYLLVSSLVRDLQEVFSGGDIDFLSDHEERESEVDSLLYLVERQIRIVFESYQAASRLNVTRGQALEYANLARCLERMMDHVNNLTLFIIEHTEHISTLKMTPPILNLPLWQESLKELMINIRTQDSHRIETARHQLKTLQTELKTYETSIFDSEKKNRQLAAAVSISESVRRLCAYSRDFGEILLNMKLSALMVEIRDG
ncbi:MAG: phosphate uptake regulator PhoU [Candidatus Poseidoniales archaeon]|nr:MAG: phosphate uptake regulator PhoU [Candidatus Poseidoniales archaeon]